MGRLGLASVLLEAVKLAFVDDIEVITIAALENNIISSPNRRLRKFLGGPMMAYAGLLLPDFLHRVDDDLRLLLVEGREHEGLVHAELDPVLLLLGFLDYAGHVVALLVVIAVDFGRDSLALFPLDWRSVLLKVVILILRS